MNKLQQEISKEFTVILNEWIGDKLYEVNSRNKEASYAGCCATHDFCDANQAIIDAFAKVMGKEPSSRNRRHQDLINGAWNLAKDNQFKVSAYSPAAMELLNS